MNKVPKGYKMTEVGVIPEDWAVKKLEFVAPLQRGFDLPNPQLKEGIYPVVYSNGIGNYHNSFMVKAPGVITGRSGTLGKVNYVTEDYWPHNTALWVTKFFNNHPLFIYYLMIRTKLERFGTGSGVPTLNRNDVHDFKVPLPSLPEQISIAETLSDTDSLIGKLEELITKKRQTKQGAMQELLTGKKRLPGFSGKWEEKTLGEIGECLIGLTYKPENVKESGLLVLRSSNIKDGVLKFENNVYVDVEVPEKLIVKEGDILICVRNGSRDLIGKCALIDKKTAGKTFGAFMALYRSPINHFIFHQFNSFLIKKQIDENIGATINQITNKNLNSFKVPLPENTTEQTAIADVLNDMDAEIERLEKKLEKYKMVKTGMMQELLTGKTRLI